MAAPWYHWEHDSLVLQIRLQPRAHCDEIVGLHRDRLKVRVTSPPLEGKANAHLVRFLAQVFQVSKKQVTVLAGTASRDKRIRIASPAKLLPGIDLPSRMSEDKSVASHPARQPPARGCPGPT